MKTLNEIKDILPWARRSFKLGMTPKDLREESSEHLCPTMLKRVYRIVLMEALIKDLRGMEVLCTDEQAKYYRIDGTPAPVYGAITTPREFWAQDLRSLSRPMNAYIINHPDPISIFEELTTNGHS